MTRRGLMIAALLTPGLALATPARARAGSSASRAGRLTAARRFAYQLQKLDVKAAARSSADLIVIDPEGDGRRLPAPEVASLRKKPGGGSRVGLAYLSIGEAEDYRPYWQASWKANPPAWLGPVNPDWPGNFEVHYWDPAWQALILGNPAAPLDRIVADGYDGVYLDIVDGFEFWEGRGQDDARTQMVSWVTRIATHARRSHAGFLVVPQNGEGLAREKGYLDQVDAVGREDLFFEGDRPQNPSEIGEAQADLSLFQEGEKPVFLIEYGRSPRTAASVYRRARASGYKALVTVRPLDRLVVSP